MNKITYLLGAGASANAIPLVLEIPFRLQAFAGYIERNLITLEVTQYLKDIHELVNELNEHNTIDGYAKALTQNKVDGSVRTRLAKLKSILCGLFTFEQLKKKKEPFSTSGNLIAEEYNPKNYQKVNRTLDPRYRSFFAKVLNNDKLDERINIISWNYDLQLEIGLENNLGYKYDELQNTCKIYPHPSCEKRNNKLPYTSFYDSPQIVKLNGTAGIFLRDNGFYNIYLDQNEYFDDQMETLLDIHKEVTRYNQYHPYLRFAWEEDEKNKEAIQYAKNMLAQTQVLVVIGYSFPVFNRLVDKEIFGQSQIRDIFLQLPGSDHNSVEYRLKGAINTNRNINIHSITDLNEFFIPNEF